MDKEFLRMQQLAGIPDINIDNNSFQEITLKYLTELHLLKKYHSKGILKENLSKNEIILIEGKLTNWLLKTGIKPTEAFIASLFNKFEKLARKLGIEDPLKYLESLRNKTLEEGGEEINENAFRNFMNKTFYKDKESGNLVSTPEKVNIKSLGLLGTYIIGLMLNINIGFEKLKEYSQKTGEESFKTELIFNTMSKNNQTIAGDLASKTLPGSTNDPTKTPIKTPLISSDSLNAVDVEFPTGEFELDTDSETELVNKLVDNVKKTISSNKNIDSLTIEYGGSIDDIGSNTGDENNPDGPDKDGLKDLRTGVGKNIADEAIKILKASGEFKDVKFNAKKVDNNNNKAGIGFDLKGTTKKETKKSKLPQTFISLRKERVKDLPTDDPSDKLTDDPSDKLTDDPSGTTDPKLDAKPNTPIDSASPIIDPKRDIANIANLNRNSQIAFVLAKTNNKLNLYRQLGIKNIINIPDGEFNNIAKGQYNGKDVSPQAKLLAQNIIRSRKSPNTFINAYAKITGTNQGGSRRKASITTGAKGQSSSAPIKENEIYSIDLLEASIDKILADNSLQTTFKQKAFLAKLINVMYFGEEGKDVLDIESSTDDRFKKEYKEIPSPLGSQEKGERYVYLDKNRDKTPDKYDVTVIKNLFDKTPQLSILLNKINNKAELADLILALFLHTNEQGSSLFSDKKIFATNTGKVRSALFGLNNRIPNTIKEILFREAEGTEGEVKDLIDVKKFYDILNTKPTILARLKKMDIIEEFYQFCLEVIFPRLNNTFKTERGVNQIKQAIALAANSSTKYKSILDAKPKPVNEEFYRMQQLAGLIKENTASDIEENQGH